MQPGVGVRGVAVWVCGALGAEVGVEGGEAGFAGGLSILWRVLREGRVRRVPTYGRLPRGCGGSRALLSRSW